MRLTGGCADEPHACCREQHLLLSLKTLIRQCIFCSVPPSCHPHLLRQQLKLQPLRLAHLTLYLLPVLCSCLPSLSSACPTIYITCPTILTSTIVPHSAPLNYITYDPLHCHPHAPHSSCAACRRQQPQPQPRQSTPFSLPLCLTSVSVCTPHTTHILCCLSQAAAPATAWTTSHSRAACTEAQAQAVQAQPVQAQAVTGGYRWLQGVTGRYRG